MKKSKFSVYNSYTGNSKIIEATNLTQAILKGKTMVGTKKGIVRGYKVK